MVAAMLVLVALVLTFVTVSSAAKPDDGIPCEACVFVVDAIEDLLRTNPDATDKEIEEYLNMVCAALGPYESQCVAWVDMEVPQIIEYLSSMNSTSVCKQMMLCPSAAGNFKLPPASDVASVEAVRVAAPQAAKPQALPCTICDYVVGYVETYLKAHENATVKEVGDAIKQNICAVLGSFEDECDLLVDTELPMVIEKLSSMTPEQVCDTLRLCTDDSVAKKVKPEALPCTLCEFVVGYVEGFIKANQNATVEQVGNALKQNVCTLLGTYEQECDALVDSELPAIITALRTLPVDEVCDTVHLCTADEDKSKAVQSVLLQALTNDVARKEAAPQAAPQDSIPCEACEFIVGYLEGYIKTFPNATIQQIETALKQNVCANLGPIAQTCDDLVDNELPQLIKALLNFPPAVVCTDVALCSSVDAAPAAAAAAQEDLSAPIHAL